MSVATLPSIESSTQQSFNKYLLSLQSMIHLFLSYNKMDFDLDFRVFLHEWVCFFCLYPQGGTLELGVVACL
jgi:hypothetical protein